MAKDIEEEKDREQRLMELFTYDAPGLLRVILEDKKKKQDEEVKRVIDIAKKFMADEDHKEFEDALSKR